MKRILIAFLISIVGIAASWLFLRPKEWTNTGMSNRKAVAHVLKTHNEVTRQNEGRLLWNPLRAGDQIFMGDKIKTSGLSSTSLELLGSSSRLEIEENSTIKMEGIGEKLKMNMLEGRVFLKQDQFDENSIDLFSGGKKVDTKGDVIVSINLDGTSKVENLKNTTENIFQDLTPNYGQEVKTLDNTVQLKWKRVNRDEEVFVEIGESSQSLYRISQKGLIKDAMINVQMKPGINYWRLITKDGSKEVASSVMRANVSKPIPANQIYPSDGEVINLADKTFDFKWVLGSAGDKIILEVSRGPNFKSLVDKIEINNQTFHTTSRIYEQGDYFWRLKTQIEGTDVWIESKTLSFKVVHGANLLSPQPVAPANGFTFYIGATGVSRVMLEWAPQEEARSYELRVVGPGLNKKIQQTTQNANVNISRSGKYTWQVTSESKDGKTSSFPVERTFEVKDFQTIQWKTQGLFHHYLDSFPIVVMDWTPIPGHAFILKISKKTDMTEGEVFKLATNNFPYRPSRDGFHYAQVSSVDESGQISGESEVYEFKVEKAPLPPTPQIAGDESLIATSRGELVVDVKNHKDNWTIISQIINAKGVLLDERKFLENEIKFNGLLPGIYSLQTFFEDQYQRKSSTPSIKELIVPEKSKILAPKIKGIKVR
jgi:hypothetical protein